MLTKEQVCKRTRIIINVIPDHENIEDCDEAVLDLNQQALLAVDLQAEVERLQTEIHLWQHMCAPIEVDGEAFANAVELSKARQEIVLLKRALELACDDAADEQCPHEFDLYACEECDGCPHGNEIHTDSERDAQCWYNYYIRTAQEQEDEK